MDKIQPEIITNPAALQERVSALRAESKSIGLVPTMGALHYGHLSLVLASKEDNDVTVISIFVNPTQFAPGEEYEKYPRTLPDDIEKLAEIGGADIVFAPSPEAMYPKGFDANVHVGGVTEVLEGKFRPTHFDGVATVVLKLFHLTRADRAYFGQKDFQQIAVVKKMAADLNVPIKIVSCPIIREPDGIAMSSRNRYLSKQERQDALVLSRSLMEAEKQIAEGERDAAVICADIRRKIEQIEGASVDYVVVADPDTLAEMERVAGNVVILLAARIGSTRLIDNRVIAPKR
ncbi:MAG: pantoate--beta-alanine ligase [Thermoguttaceae bacterium]|nr:pantoate--beta-alanine ligase [Thermoguttaceae bacterium]